MESHLASIYVPFKKISTICFNNDDKKLLVSSKTGGILLYTINSKRRPVVFEAASFSPTCSMFSDDSMHIYGGSDEGKIAMWQVHDTKPKLLITGHSTRVTSISFSRASNYIITSSNDKVIKIWKPDLKFVGSFIQHACQVTCVSTHPTKELVISGDAHGNIYCWNLSSPNDAPIWKKSLRVKEKCSISSVSFDPTGALFCVSTSDGFISLWDFSSLKLVQTHRFSSNHVTYHPIQPLILSTGNDCIPHVFSVEASSIIMSFKGHKGFGVCCSWAYNGSMCATADTNGVIYVWKMPEKKFSPEWINTNNAQENEHIVESLESDVSNDSAPKDFTITSLCSQILHLSDEIHQMNVLLMDQEERLAKLINSSI